MSDIKNKTDLSKYIVNVQGKDFITFPGLLAEAHAQGLSCIDTELLQPIDATNPIVKATVKLGEKSFTGYGDANSNNVAKKVAGALIRMAETRAVARALRFACNIDMTALEELDVEGDKPSKTNNSQNNQTFKAPAVAAPKVEAAPVTPPTTAEPQKVSTPAPKTTTKSFGAAPVVAPAVTPGPALGKRKAAATEPNFP